MNLVAVHRSFPPRTPRDERPRGRRARARRTVLHGVLLFALATLALNVAVDTRYPELRDPEYGHRARAVAALDRRGQPLVLFLGSSRTQMAVRPAVMGDGFTAYNFGQSGAGPLQLLMNLERLLAAGVKPDAVLVELMPPTLAQKGPAEVLLADRLDRLAAADVRRVATYCDDPSAVRTPWLWGRLNPWHEMRFAVVSHAAPWLLPWQQRIDFQWRDMHPDGFLPYPFEMTPAERARGTAAARTNYAELLANFHVDPLIDRVLRDLIARCRAEGIRVGLYLLPEGESFRAMYPPAAREVLAGYLRTLEAECGVAVFDATDWLPGNDDYADGHHMLRPAAEPFSRRFGATVAGWVRE